MLQHIDPHIVSARASSIEKLLPVHESFSHVHDNSCADNAFINEESIVDTVSGDTVNEIISNESQTTTMTA